MAIENTTWSQGLADRHLQLALKLMVQPSVAYRSTDRIRQYTDEAIVLTRETEIVLTVHRSDSTPEKRPGRPRSDRPSPPR